MGLIHLVALAMVQGLTEFLPISSSAHLVLLPRLAGWPDQGLAFDVAVHVGTLSAVIAYFRRELDVMSRAWLGSVRGRGTTAEARLAWGVLLGTVPLGLAGLAFYDLVAAQLRSPLVIAAATAFFGIALWLADRLGPRRREEHAIRPLDVIVIGLAQALALIPGTSRSGITITAGLAVGLTREAASRFSFLLSIPAIVLAGGYETWQLARAATPVAWLDMLVATVLAAVSAYVCIALFLRLIERVGMLPFALYRLLLAAGILVVSV